MYFFKKCGIYLVFILIVVSIYNDLTSGTLPKTTDKPEPLKQMEFKTSKYNVIKVKVKPGDTVLSITESVNDSLNMLDINQIYADFKRINDADPQQLITGSYYYFPLYDE